MILSFDIGIKNLSYCLIKSQLNNLNNNNNLNNLNNIEIIDWDIINILKDNEKVKSINIDELSKRLYMKLSEVFKDKEFDIVLLENQPVLKNPVMKSVQMLIYGFFLYQKTNLIKNEIKHCFDNILFVEEGYVEGGDILNINNHFIIGLSHRTNKLGANNLSKILQSLGATVEICKTAPF